MWTDALTTDGDGGLASSTEVDCLDDVEYDGVSYPDVMLEADLSYIQNIPYQQEIYIEYGPIIDWILNT